MRHPPKKETASVNVLFKPLLDVDSGGAPHACCRDGLLVAGVDDISSSEDARDRGHRVFFVNQVPVFVGFDLPAEEIGDGRVTDGDEGARCFNRLCGAVLGVFKHGAGEALFSESHSLTWRKVRISIFGWLAARSYMMVEALKTSRR